MLHKACCRLDETKACRKLYMTKGPAVSSRITIARTSLESALSEDVPAIVYHVTFGDMTFCLITLHPILIVTSPSSHYTLSLTLRLA